MDCAGKYVALAGRRTGCATFHTRGVATGLGYAGLSALLSQSFILSPLSLLSLRRDASRLYSVQRRRGLKARQSTAAPEKRRDDDVRIGDYFRHVRTALTSSAISSTVMEAG
jgi:hypothetical protein